MISVLLFKSHFESAGVHLALIESGLDKKTFMIVNRHTQAHERNGVVLHPAGVVARLPVVDIRVDLRPFHAAVRLNLVILQLEQVADLDGDLVLPKGEKLVDLIARRR